MHCRFSLARAMNSSWGELAHEHITGPRALDMQDTTCAFDESQMRRLVPGYMLKRDLQMNVRATIPMHA